MAMNNTDFAVFILTHGRPDRVDTYKTLLKSGYTGKIYIIIDNEDKTADKYYKNFGDKVIMFDKAAIAETFDEGDNFQDRRAVIYARNASFHIAKDLGITYFMQLDDDYYEFRYQFNDKLEFCKFSLIKNLDAILNLFLQFYRSIDCKSIAFAQTGDFIGGGKGSFGASLSLKRKAMNTFICSTERPFNFIGRVNEDVNTYTWFHSLGNLFLTIPNVVINQRDTQSSKGGMTEMYLDSGTYIKSFYTVMYQPSSVVINTLGVTHKRLHHQIKWDNTVPCIISEEYRKPDIQAATGNGS